MLTIGAFARRRGLGASLRHDEAVGVPAPAAVDPETGYRYYRAAQLERLHRIQALQDLGLSLDVGEEGLDFHMLTDFVCRRASRCTSVGRRIRRAHST